MVLQNLDNRRKPKTRYLVLLLSVILLISVVGLILIPAIIQSAYYSNSELMKYLVATNPIKKGLFERKIQTYMEDTVGNKYFQDNFRLIELRYYPATLGPLTTNATQKLTYEFLPFSDKYKYYVDIRIDVKTGEISQDLPECVFESSANRCDFSITYSQAYDKAKERLESINSINLVQKDGEYKWKAIDIQGDPLCGAHYIYFFIDAKTGEETNIEEKISNYCI